MNVQSIDIDLPSHPFPDAIMRQLREHCEQAYPNEAYGIVTRGKGDDMLVLRAEEDGTPDSYTMSASLILNARQQGEMVAFYHSHPDACASPSIQDLATMTLGDQPSWPGITWLIGSVYDARCVDIRAYLWNASLTDFVRVE